MGEARQECRDSIGEARSGDRPRSPPPRGASSRAAGQTRPPRARSDDRTRSGSDYRARRRALLWQRATAVEYGLIAALIAVAAVVVMGTVGTNLSGVFSQVAASL